MSAKHIKPGSTAHRSFAVDRSAVSEETRTVELAFSSEAPYERYWGIEVLDHTQTSIRLGRLTAGGPLLMDHDSRDHIGVIESVQIGADRVGRAVVRFGKSARAEEVFRDVVDGIRRNVSVGYVIHKAQLVETGKDGSADTYRVTDWEPFEVSLVSVPADPSVGVGRAAETADHVEFIESQQERTMSDINVEEIRAVASAAGIKEANQRVADILAMGKQYKCEQLAVEALHAGKSVVEFKDMVIEQMANNPVNSATIGMNQKEAQRFSFQIGRASCRERV